jgi:predicted Zn-dependent peptidase
MGTCKTVASLTHERVRSFFDARFGRGNTTVGVVGNVSAEELKGPMERVIEKYLYDTLPDSPAPPSVVRAPAAAKEVYQTRSTEAECIVYGFPAPGFREPEYGVIKVLDSIVGGSMDSRLFSEIREKQGLVYQIGSSYPALEWQGMFAVSLVSTRTNHDRILESLAKEIDRLKETLAEEDEIERAKTYLRGTFLMSMERNSDQALLLAKYHSLGLGIDFINRYPAMIEKVTAESIQRVAREYFTQPTLAIVGPGDGAEPPAKSLRA